jgi:hypothetical protein
MYENKKKIRTEWAKAPDMRFGQLMYCFFSQMGDPFNWEEDEFISKLQEYMEDKKENVPKHIASLNKTQSWQYFLDVMNKITVMLPVQFTNDHLFIELDNELWLIDTGAPTSFGASRIITIGRENFMLGQNFHGYTADTVSQFVGVSCAGLLGADVLNQFDLIFDALNGKITISTAELSCEGQSVQMDEFMCIPIITMQIKDNDYRMIFDTGAQISYFQDDLLTEFPSAGIFKDFHFTIGHYETETFNIPVMLDDTAITLRCGGTLPDSIGTTLTAASVRGIIGNELLKDRIVGYFPRRRMMVLGEKGG